MKIIKPYAKMLVPPGVIDQNEQVPTEFSPEMGIALLKHVEWCSRISHRSEDKVTEDSYKRILQNVVIEHGDWSVTEHAVVSVDAYVDRGITHEWVRHRMGAYTQESTRFVNYEKKMEPSFVYPEVDVECEHCLRGVNPVTYNIPSQKYIHVVNNSIIDCVYRITWLRAIESCGNEYRQLLKDCKWTPQLARSVFPNALASRIIVTYNLRNWRHFFLMRTTKETHPQMKEVSIPLLKEFQEKIPILYDDIEPNARQVDNLKKAR